MARLTRNPIWPSTWLIALLLVVSALLPLPQNNAIGGLPTICAFNHFTGLPCPGCGLTRSWVSMAHGQFHNAFVWHPLGPLLFLGANSYMIWSARAARMGTDFPHAARWQMRFLFAGSALMLGFWALRLAGVFPLPGG